MLEIANVPGCAQASIAGGLAATVAFQGKKDVARDAPVDDATVFEAASLSKPTVAYVTLLLADRGLLDLDVPLARYLDGSPVADDPRGERITARHVLSHASGLQNWRFREGDRLKIAFDPGTKFSYSGEGFVLLQRALERRSGTAFTRLMREQLFAPLGMPSSSFLWRSDLDAHLARPHSNRGTGLEGSGQKSGRALAEFAAAQVPPRSPEDFTYPEIEAAAQRLAPDRPAFPNFLVPNAAASLLTTARDYAKFMALLLDDASAPAALRLRPATRQAMRSPQVRLAARLSWGLGIGLEDRGTDRLLWHWGDNGGYKCFLVADPARRRARVVFTNGAGGQKVAERLVRAEYGDLAAFLWI